MGPKWKFQCDVIIYHFLSFMVKMAGNYYHIVDNEQVYSV